jgi:hypothetical protein
MNVLDGTPVPVRELPARRHAAIRGMLLDEVVGGMPPARPVLLTRRRTLAAVAIVVLLTAQLWPLPGERSPILAWTHDPQEIDGITSADLEEYCLRSTLDTARRLRHPEPGSPQMALPREGWQTMVVDRRGNLAVVLMVDGTGYFHACAYGDIKLDPTYGIQAHGGGGFGRLPPLPDGEVLYVEGGGTAIARRNVDPSGLTWYEHGFGHVWGGVAPEVSRVEVTLTDGSEVRASVANGFYAAVWPGDATRILLWSRVEVADVATVRAYDAAGRLLDDADVAASASGAGTPIGLIAGRWW